MSHFNDIKEAYYTNTMYALAVGYTYEALEIELNKVEELEIYAGCEGMRQAIDTWNNSKDNLNCRIGNIIESDES